MTALNHRHGIGIARREFLQVGFSGVFGLGLPGLLAGRAAAAESAAPRARSLILIFLTGGLSHIDSLDPKPNAPDGIRGEFAPIATRTPGLFLSEHLPGLAARSEQIAVVRSLSHIHTNHLNATHQILTGHPQPGAFFDKIASRSDYPCYASGLNALRPRSDGMPSGVMLPTFLMEGPLTWPGQNAGFLGARHDPWQIKQDPNSPSFRIEELSLPDGFSVERLGRRRDLLGELSTWSDRVGAAARTSQENQGDQRGLAYSLLLSGSVARAFEIQREDPRVRDRYGRHTFGQSILLAKRLVQAGVPIVQVNMGRVQTWDTHNNNFKTLKERLLPPTDQGVSALLDDLQREGMLDETLVIVSGEFGRTPKIGASTGNANNASGRDHWSKVFSAVFAGGGVRGGQVIGQSDRIGAYPAGKPYSSGDFGATVYSALGIDPKSEIRDVLGRPIALCGGQPIAPLFTGASA